MDPYRNGSVMEAYRLAVTRTTPAVRLRALDAPTMVMPADKLHPGRSGSVRVPAPCFLIEHHNGTVLFDASLTALAYEDARRAYGDRADRFGLDISPRLRPDRQLAELGYAPDAVTFLVLSHMHFDHAGAVPLFPKANLVVGWGELEAATASVDPYRARVYHEPDLEALRCIPGLYVRDVPVDLFGDGSVVAIPMPGHTNGSIGLLVSLASRKVLLPGDAVRSHYYLNNLVPYEIDTDMPAAVDTIRQIQAVTAQPNVGIWISHDPDDWTAYGGRPQD
jgi:N-acyl homoserine lactone hydrolase